METISLIAVVEKVEVVTQFQFENQLFNSETPRQRLFYCSGLKFDMDLNCVTELEAEVRFAVCGLLMAGACSYFFCLSQPGA
jgi:hypothetical protein